MKEFRHVWTSTQRACRVARDQFDSVLTASLALIVAPGLTNPCAHPSHRAGGSASLVSAGRKRGAGDPLGFRGGRAFGALAQFADPIAGGVAPQLLALGLTFALLTWMIFSALAHPLGEPGKLVGKQAKTRGRLALVDRRRPYRPRDAPAFRIAGSPRFDACSDRGA